MKLDSDTILILICEKKKKRFHHLLTEAEACSVFYLIPERSTGIETDFQR